MVVIVVMSGVVGSVVVAALVVIAMGCWVAKGDETTKVDV